MDQIISSKGKCTKAGECSHPALGIQYNQVLEKEVPLQNGVWLGQLIVVRRQPAFTTLLSLAEEASGQLPGSISWKKFTMGQTINEKKVGQRPRHGWVQASRRRGWVSPIKSLRIIMRQFLGVSGTIRRKLGPRWVHRGRSLHHKFNMDQ